MVIVGIGIARRLIVWRADKGDRAIRRDLEQGRIRAAADRPGHAFRRGHLRHRRLVLGNRRGAGQGPRPARGAGDRRGRRVANRKGEVIRDA